MSTKVDDALFQSSLARAPRRGSVIALTVDSTARPYRLDNIPLVTEGASRMFVALQADGGAIYYYFSDASHDDLDEATIIAAGDTLEFGDEYGAMLTDGAIHDLALDADVDKYLIVKTISSDATLRIFVSSDAQ